MKKSKPLTGAQKRKQKRELHEREEREQRELVADIERLKLGPTDLWKLITEYPDIFETHVLKSGYLNETDIKMFYECCRASRSAVIRAKIELQERFSVSELSSISTLEMAWEGYPWGERIYSPGGKVITLNQETFCCGVAAYQGNLDMLKYCCENGCEVHEGTCANAAEEGQLDCLEYLRSRNCPWDKRTCEQAHENNHIDILTYAVKNKCPGYEAYEQYVPKQ
jgi:hypothetical protein